MLTTKSGHALHPIGIGTWSIASRINQYNLDSLYRGVEPVRGNEESEISALRYSITKGQNHIDCAELYGGFYTDEVVGRAIAGMQRQDLYIADKLWKTSVGPGQVRPTVEQMLTKLGTDYIDLLYIHAPWEGINWQAAIPQIDQLIDAGIVRHFGVSNFTVSQMQEAMGISRHPIAANQVNFNVLHQQEAPQDFRAFCKEQNIQVVAYQPIKRQEVLTNQVVQGIAQDHGATAAQVALAWLIQVGALPIPKAVQPAHIDENLGAVDLRLTTQDMQRLSALAAV